MTSKVFACYITDFYAKSRRTIDAIYFEVFRRILWAKHS